MKILFVGGGGREHVLVWKLHQSHKVSKIYCAPGNAGIADLAENMIFKQRILKHFVISQGKKIDLT